MKQREQPPHLAGSEYISSDQSENTEIAGARWEFMEVVRRVFPRFFSDADNQLTPRLLAWARAFHAEETWILEGALQTLSLWHQDRELRESLDICGFRSFRCVDTLTSDEERRFQFEHAGWDPQFQRWASYRAYIQKHFTEKLRAYEERLRSLVESRGAVRARYRYSVDDFEWFALYQLANMSTVRILKQRPDLKGDESTILKGVKAAAALLHWSTRRGRKRNQEI